MKKQTPIKEMSVKDYCLAVAASKATIQVNYDAFIQNPSASNYGDLRANMDRYQQLIKSR